MSTQLRGKGPLLRAIVMVVVAAVLVVLAAKGVAWLLGTPAFREHPWHLAGILAAVVVGVLFVYLGRNSFILRDFSFHVQPGVSVRFDPGAGRAEVTPPADVFISASAPRAAAPGSAFVVRLAAYVEALREPTLDLLRHLSPASERYVDLRRCRWAHGARIRVRMTLVGSAAAPLEEEFVWRNASNIVDFSVEVPAIDAPDTLLPRLEVFVEDVRVTTILLTVQVLAVQGGPASARARRVTVTAEPARTAFASYARRDRRRVLDRVASIRIAAGLEIWLDHLSLVPGQRWKERIEQKIRESDLFLLFWSPRAKQSKWVTWEWKLALAKKPRDRFQVHPLEYAPPPPELADLQVDDVLMTLRNAPAPG